LNQARIARLHRLIEALEHCLIGLAALLEDPAEIHPQRVFCGLQPADLNRLRCGNRCTPRLFGLPDLAAFARRRNNRIQSLHGVEDFDRADGLPDDLARYWFCTHAIGSFTHVLYFTTNPADSSSKCPSSSTRAADATSRTPKVR